VKKNILAVAAFGLSLAACSSGGTNAFTLTATPSVKAGLALGAAAAIYLIYDPLAPNWEIEEAKLAEDTYRFSMTMKRFHTGGAGESIQIMKRRATQLKSELGHGDYQIVEYTEGIESQTLGARRVAYGVIRFAKREAADSFSMNDPY